MHFTDRVSHCGLLGKGFLGNGGFNSVSVSQVEKLPVELSDSSFDESNIAVGLPDLKTRYE